MQEFCLKISDFNINHFLIALKDVLTLNSQLKQLTTWLNSTII